MHSEVLATGWIWPKLNTQHTNCGFAAANHILIHLMLSANNAEVLLLLLQLRRLYTVRKVGAAVDGVDIFLTDPAKVLNVG